MENSKYTERIYNANEIVFFKKTKEAFGGLSNMAAGFPLVINGMQVLTSEALYQACRFPHLPDIQQKILNEKSPMTAKMVGKPYRSQSREDFESVKVDIMRWCLRIKLAQNFVEFGKLLSSTNYKPIVEDSHKDTFWGAVRDKKDENVLKGVNALGRLLMELRQQYLENPFSWKLLYIQPLKIPNFNLLGEPINLIDERTNFVTHIAKQYGLMPSLYPNPNNLNGSYSSKTQIKNSLQQESIHKVMIETENIVIEKHIDKKNIKINSEKNNKTESPNLFAQR